jgi:hypothetical protein
MEHAGLNGAGALVEVAWVLMEERGEESMAQEGAGTSIAKLCGETFAVDADDMFQRLDRDVARIDVLMGQLLTLSLALKQGFPLQREKM